VSAYFSNRCGPYGKSAGEEESGGGTGMGAIGRGVVLGLASIVPEVIMLFADDILIVLFRPTILRSRVCYGSFINGYVSGFKVCLPLKEGPFI